MREIRTSGSAGGPSGQSLGLPNRLAAAALAMRYLRPNASGARTRPAAPQRISSVTTYGTASSR